MTRRCADPISRSTRVKMLASCHNRTSALERGEGGVAEAGLEQPARERRKRSKQTTRTTAGESYARTIPAPTQPVKTGLDRLHLHARPRAEQPVGTRLADPDLEVPHAADVHERLPRPGLGVRLGGRRGVPGVHAHKPPGRGWGPPQGSETPPPPPPPGPG